VAIDAAARLQNRELIVRQLETLASHQDAVQAYQIAALSRQPAIVGRILRGLLVDDAPVSRLNAWIDAAGSLVDPEALERVRELASHRSADVRVHVARALRRLATPETQQVLSRLLEDEDWRVRAQSARALGALRCENAIAGLAAAVRDRSWWVRYRAALALAQVGGRGRTALLALAVSDDAMASDMSALVSELTSAAVVEMSEV
jgi:HEAT repeat protein